MSAGRWLVTPAKGFDLAGVDPGSATDAPGDKHATKDVAKDLLEELASWQRRLWAEGKRSLLVVLQAMDTGGKDGTLRHLSKGVDAQGCRVTAFKPPTAEELRHDFLWRAHRGAPAAGEIGIFNRSHYEDVLIVRVHSLVPESVWRPRYAAINDFERHLHEAGTTIVKFWLHISPEEQKRRLLARLENPEKRWKFNPEDLAERKRWRDYQEAAEEMLWQTSTVDAPWYVVPADHKWYRNWAVTRVLVDTLSAIDPQYPPPDDDADYEIPDI